MRRAGGRAARVALTQKRSARARRRLEGRRSRRPSEPWEVLHEAGRASGLAPQQRGAWVPRMPLCSSAPADDVEDEVGAPIDVSPSAPHLQEAAAPQAAPPQADHVGLAGGAVPPSAAGARRMEAAAEAAERPSDRVWRDGRISLLVRLARLMHAIVPPTSRSPRWSFEHALRRHLVG